MKSLNLAFCRCEPRRFPRNIELAFMTKRGSFRLALYFHLPIYWFSHKTLKRDAERILQRSEQ